MVLIEASVRTNREKFSVCRSGGRLIINVRGQPRGGEANAEIVKELRRLTGKDARILSGLKSKKKVIEIAGINGQELEALYESGH